MLFLIDYHWIRILILWSCDKVCQPGFQKSSTRNFLGHLQSWRYLIWKKLATLLIMVISAGSHLVFPILAYFSAANCLQASRFSSPALSLWWSLEPILTFQNFGVAIVESSRCVLRFPSVWLGPCSSSRPGRRLDWNFPWAPNAFFPAFFTASFNIVLILVDLEATLRCLFDLHLMAVLWIDKKLEDGARLKIKIFTMDLCLLANPFTGKLMFFDRFSRGI